MTARSKASKPFEDPADPELWLDVPWGGQPWSG
jgi:hypothetical protein